jgi:hypothetical protein
MAFNDPAFADNLFWTSGYISVSRDALLTAIGQVEHLGAWLEPLLIASLYGQR